MDEFQPLFDRLDFLAWLTINSGARRFREDWFLATHDYGTANLYDGDIYGDVYHRDGRHFTVTCKRTPTPYLDLLDAACKIINGPAPEAKPFPVIPRRDE